MKKRVLRFVSVLFFSGLASTVAYAAPIMVSQGGLYLGSIDPYSGSETGADNYDYYDLESHIITGPDPVANGGLFFFYEGSDGLSFNMNFGRTGSGSGPDPSGEFNAVITLDGSTTDASTLVADEGHELSEIGVDVFETTFTYVLGIGDGGVIGEIAGSDWELTIDASSMQDISSLAAYSADGSSIGFAIDTSQDIVFSVGAHAHAQVSEPSTLVLLGLGLLSVAGVARKRKG